MVKSPSIFFYKINSVGSVLQDLGKKVDKTPVSPTTYGQKTEKWPFSRFSFINQFLPKKIFRPKFGWSAVWFTIRNCEPGSQFCDNLTILVEPVTPGDSSKSVRGAHASS